MPRFPSGPFNLEEGYVLAASTDWTVPYPTGVQPGDLIGGFITAANNLGNLDCSFPAGWRNSRTNTPSNLSCIQTAKKLSDGTESGTFNIHWNQPSIGSYKIFVISRWNPVLGINFAGSDPNGGHFLGMTGTNGTSTTATIPVSTEAFSWKISVEGALLFAYGQCDGTGQFPDGSQTYASAGYERLGTTMNSGSSGASLIVVFRNMCNSSRVGPDFPIDVSTPWESAIFAVRPWDHGPMEADAPIGFAGRGGGW